MKRTYPAKRSHIAKHDDVAIRIGTNDGEPVYVQAECASASCAQPLDVGVRIVGSFWAGTLMHSSCATAEEANR